MDDISAIYKEAQENNDYTTTTFLDPYVIEQIHSIKELNNYLVNAERCVDPLGIYLFDQQNNFKIKAAISRINDIHLLKNLKPYYMQKKWDFICNPGHLSGKLDKNIIFAFIKEKF